MFVENWIVWLLEATLLLRVFFNVLPSLSLFTFVFICIFVLWLMGSCDFCFSCSGLLGDRFFSLSLMLFGGRIGDLCNGCFDGDFVLLGVVRV